MNHSADANKMDDTPSVCPFCGSDLATLDDGTSCGDSEGNWTAFRCLTSWHRGYHDPRKLQSKTCETAERHKLYDRIKRLEEAVDAAISFCEFHGPVGATPDTARLIAKNLRRAKEAKP